MSIDARLKIDLGKFQLNAEFSVPAAGVTAVFGPSGCGKTTLLRAMAGLEHAPDGYLKVGEEVWQDGTRFLPPHRRPLGYVFQETSLFSHLSVRGNLEYGLKRVPDGTRRIPFDRAVSLLDLQSLLDRQPVHLSGGERQRVAIARALAASPRLMLMDEPLAALDQKRKEEILPFLERLQEELEIPVLYVSHVADEVARLADHLVLLDRGIVRAAGPIVEMLTRFDLPLAHDADAGTIIEATVTECDKQYHLSLLDFAGGRITVSHHELTVGQSLRLRILARDVSLALERQTGTSILNILPAEVEALEDENPAQVMVRLSVGGVPLLARVTRKSSAILQLKPGKKVFAQVKSVAILG